jgi:hypothetical protein
MKTPNHFHPGVYKFSFPFLGNYNEVGSCNVELTIGNIGANTGSSYFVTVLIKSSESSVPPLEHFIEAIATQIRHTFFGKLLSEDLNKNVQLNENQIRWIQSIPFYKNGSYKQVWMQWSDLNKRYYAPVWEEMENDLSVAS